MPLGPVTLACRCGANTFAIRADANQGVALVTCLAGHCSFVLDTRDYWADILQDGRPRALVCKCQERLFTTLVTYQLLAPGGPVSSVSVRARCASCKRERRVFDQEIDYEPTDTLIERPLDPVDDPWLKARRTELTAFWLAADLHAVIRYASTLTGARLWFVGFRAPPRELGPEDMIAAIVGASTYTLLITNGPIAWPEQLRDVWRSLPVVQVSSPFSILYPSGSAALTYLTYAAEDVVDGRIEKRSPPFVAFTVQLERWLRATFVGGRGAHAVDNAAEKARLGF